jgi:hypothetical protein
VLGRRYLVAGGPRRRARVPPGRGALRAGGRRSGVGHLGRGLGCCSAEPRGPRRPHLSRLGTSAVPGAGDARHPWRPGQSRDRMSNQPAAVTYPCPCNGARGFGSSEEALHTRAPSPPRQRLSAGWAGTELARARARGVRRRALGGRALPLPLDLAHRSGAG